MTSALFPGAGVKMEHFQAALDPRKQELLEARFLGARVSDALIPLGARYKTQKVPRTSPPSHIKALAVDAVTCSSENTTTTPLVRVSIFIIISFHKLACKDVVLRKNVKRGLLITKCHFLDEGFLITHLEVFPKLQTPNIHGRNIYQIID